MYSRIIKHKTKRAYTLIEILLVMALIGMIAGFSLPVFQGFVLSNQLDTSKGIVVSAIRSAKNSAQGGLNDSSWGVSIQSNSVTLYSGDNYASRDTDYDVVYEIPNVQLSGASEVIFEQLTGFPTSTPTINLSGYSNTKSIVINEIGTVY